MCPLLVAFQLQNVVFVKSAGLAQKDKRTGGNRIPNGLRGQSPSAKTYLKSGQHADNTPLVCDSVRSCSHRGPDDGNRASMPRQRFLQPREGGSLRG